WGLAGKAPAAGPGLGRTPRRVAIGIRRHSRLALDRRPAWAGGRRFRHGPRGRAAAARRTRVRRPDARGARAPGLPEPRGGGGDYAHLGRSAGPRGGRVATGSGSPAVDAHGRGTLAPRGRRG